METTRTASSNKKRIRGRKREREREFFKKGIVFAFLLNDKSMDEHFKYFYELTIKKVSL